MDCNDGVFSIEIVFRRLLPQFSVANFSQLAMERFVRRLELQFSVSILGRLSIDKVLSRLLLHFNDDSPAQFFTLNSESKLPLQSSDGILWHPSTLMDGILLFAILSEVN